jgi:transcription-repair coupling factor (superfamily II helicase)
MYAKNLAGSLRAVLVASVWRGELKRNPATAHLVVIAPDDDAADALRSDLETLIGADDVLWYAESDKKLALDAEQLNTQLVGVTGALTTLVGMERACIVAPAHALVFPVPAKQELRSNLVELRRGERLQFDEFVTTLMTSGFDRKDFVETTGDIAVRGGLVDVFAPGMENPLRIEFFGDEIDSLREFDPLSQRSIKDLQQVALVTHLFHNDEHLANATLLDYLPPETLLVQSFPEEIAAALQTHITKYADDYPDFPLNALFERLDTMRGLAINSFRVNENANMENATTIDFHAAAQPAFQSSIAALVQETRRLAHAEYGIFLASDGAEQLKRFQDLLDSAFEGGILKTGTQVLPADRAAELSNEAALAFALASLEDTSERIGLLPMSLCEGFVFPAANIALFTEHQTFTRRRASRERKRGSGAKANAKGISMKELQQLRRGDYVVHADKGVAQFDGLETITVSGGQQESVRLLFAGGDKMFVHLNYINRLQKYSADEGVKPSLTKLGTGEWQRKKDRTKKHLQDIARDLIRLYAERKMQPGFAFPADTLWQKEMEASFMYEDTPDQAQATLEVKDDMESQTPMDRLVCGDVGFGKTEVAIRAAFKAVQSGKQVAVLVPTTILAEQHFSSFRDRLDRYAVNIACLSRFRSAGEQKEILQRMEQGLVDVLIGTHRILSKDVKFKELGLLIVDEEHRFGVAAKEKLRQMRVQVDTMTLTATPIPRTLNFSLMGARDVSVINTPPRNRLPVKTEIAVWNDKTLFNAIERELQRGGQLFMVSDRIGDLDALSQQLQDLVPRLRVAVAHGQMAPEQLEAQMERFMERKVDVLLATKIIESGIDIPNANTIIIHNADNFGLAELYQLRGRVGRSNTQAYCYLIIPPPQTLSRLALKRLQAMEEFSELGSGFNLAMRDLEIRGAGNLLGAEQSGFISDIGFELYQKILDEAVQELKMGEFADLFGEENAANAGGKGIVSSKRRRSRIADAPTADDIELPHNDELTVDVDGDAMLPRAYIPSEVERYEFYKKLFRSPDLDALQNVVSEMRDRFGGLPESALQLVEAVQLRIAALPTGFGHVSLKAGTLQCEFPPEDKIAFYTTIFPVMITALASMSSIQLLPKGKKVLVQSKVGSLEAAIALLHEIVRATKQALFTANEARVSLEQAHETVGHVEEIV